MSRVRVTFRTFPKKHISAFQLFFLQRLLSQRHAQKCCVEYSNIYLCFLFCLNSYFFYFYYIFYFNIFYLIIDLLFLGFLGPSRYYPHPRPSTLDARPKGRLPPASSYWRVRLLPIGVEAFWTKKEGRKGGGGRSIQVKHVFLLKHPNVDSVYFSARALNFNAISKLFIMFVTDFWQCMCTKIIALWNLCSLARWRRNCWWKEREIAHLVREILTRALEGGGGVGRQIHKLSLSGDCFKDFYSLDDEFPTPCHLNTNGFYSICVITI